MIVRDIALIPERGTVLSERFILMIDWPSRVIHWRAMLRTFVRT